MNKIRYHTSTRISLALILLAIHCRIDAFCPQSTFPRHHYYFLSTSQFTKIPIKSRHDTVVYIAIKATKEQSNKHIQEKKDDLLNLLSNLKPNEATPTSLTNDILQAVSILEPNCPTDEDSVLNELNGNWELIWTVQDKQSGDDRSSLLRNWINPLENQAYSNNPLSRDDKNNGNGIDGNESRQGRANPILPQNIQNNLEKIGFLINENSNDDINDKSMNSNDSLKISVDTSTNVKSSQAIDLRKGRVRNVVSVLINNPIPSPFRQMPWQRVKSSNDKFRGSLTVDVNFQPNGFDKRKIDVKFNECRISIQNSPLDVTIPLGPIGPTGEIQDSSCTL